MKNEITTVKAIATTAMSILTSLFGALTVPVLLMVVCNVIDYATGLMAAKNRQDGGISSYRSIRGIQKKITMWLLVVVGAVIDQLIIYASGTIGWVPPFTFLIACVVAVWIVCNEIISVLENMIDIGVELPGFLMPLVKGIKKQVEEMANAEEREEK